MVSISDGVEKYGLDFSPSAVGRSPTKMNRLSPRQNSMTWSCEENVKLGWKWPSLVKRLLEHLEPSQQKIVAYLITVSVS